VLPVKTPTSITPRDIEALKTVGSPSNVKDPVVRSKKGSGPISGPIQNFDGACLPFGPRCEQPSGGSCLPPDTNGEVGATQYVQMVNTDFTVFSKTGAVLRGATPINQLWANTDGECKTHNDGDPVVVYDQLAKRWLLSQFIVAGADEQYGECIAVSTASDATGAYYLYEFRFGDISPATFHDYPKLGVWPDGYYMSSNEFPDGQLTSSGAGAFAFERSKMLVGQPARVIYFDEARTTRRAASTSVSSRATSTVRRSRRPGGRTSSRRSTIRPRSRRRRRIPVKMRLWKFHVDWANPANSTFGNNGAPSYELPVEPFARPQCVYGYGPNCVPQKGGAQDLDSSATG
jgi:hypothetical protein